MCNAFSAIVHKNGKVYWKAGIDSHDKLMEEFNLSQLDNTCSPDDMTLAKVEITPPADKKYPYLLRDLEIGFPGHVWSTDITYIRLDGGFAYCTAVIDWYSRYVLSWRVSNTLDTGFCLEALEEALEVGKPEIFNTDQGVQYTSSAFTGALERAGIKISMDGKGRALDNIFVERLWRSLKYEDIYLKDYSSVKEARQGIDKYFSFYNNERLHQSLDYRCPRDVFLCR